ncbi:MAG TPA: GNAT family N-acetyltransferase [Myxococcaceae bacterium]
MAATAGYRIEWSSELGTLVAVEPQLSEVAAHAAELAAGYNEPWNARLMGHDAPFSAEEVIDHYATMVEEAARPFLLFLDDTLVGDADLRGIHDGAAEFAFMIAARDRQGRGLGTRLAQMIHAFGFTTLGLDRMYASIAPENQASRRVFEKLGYRLDLGTEARSYADEPGDLTMVIRRAEFLAVHPGLLDQLRIQTLRGA